MNRQQYITIEQVRSKITEAQTRQCLCINRALCNQDNANFDVYMLEAGKAHDDAKTWMVVLAKLNELASES